MLERSPHNPLISPGDVTASREDLEVVGTFNAGVTNYGDEVILLIRVAERPVNLDHSTITCPYYEQGELRFRYVKRDDPEWDTTDSRKVSYLKSGDLYLTSVSHLRLARSRDGIQFEIEAEPWMVPTGEYEAFGVEDARITRIGSEYYVNYTAVSPYGIATGLARTKDFTDVRREGIIFPPSNRDVTLFPEKIAGLYVCYHRPMPDMFGGMNIWTAVSPDLRHWGSNRVVLAASKSSGYWDAGRIGGGAPPIWTEQGWLNIYHAADQNQNYHLGVFLSALDDPSKVIARSKEPIFSPSAPYEKEGFFNNVVFTCGTIVRDGTVFVYYGAADEHIAMATASVDNLLELLGN